MSVVRNDDGCNDLLVSVRKVTLQPIVNRLKHTQSAVMREGIVVDAGLVDFGPCPGGSAEGRGLGFQGTHNGKPNLTLASLLKFPSSLWNK